MAQYLCSGFGLILAIGAMQNVIAVARQLFSGETCIMQCKSAKLSWVSFLLVTIMIAALYIFSYAPSKSLWKKAGSPKAWSQPLQTFYWPVRCMYRVSWLETRLFQYDDWWDNVIAGPVDDPAWTRPEIP
jgi:hypothetical protein